MPLNEILGWVAAVTGMVAALMVSLNFGRKVTGYGFVIFTVSSIAWIVTGWIDDEISLLSQNVVLLAINLLGIYRWLIYKAPGGAGTGGGAGGNAGGGDRRGT